VNVSSALAALEANVRAVGPSVTAYSGGVDSTLVAVVAARVHGPAALAVTGVSASLSGTERTDAARLARELGLRHLEIETDELARPEYRANAGDRCYHCKSELYDRLLGVARAHGLAAVLSGDNLDDLGDHRPGLRAGLERGVRRPLVDAGLGKDAVRALARELGLPNRDKPAAPCLASRVPHGRAVDASVLARIELAERAVAARGFAGFRVRDHGDVARIELLPDQMGRALVERGALVEAVRAAGYRFVALDLAGFRSGSLNVVLDGKGRR
jgi:uncharacterized protein